MPRTTADAQITTKAARDRLPEQHEPHWRGIEGGLALGYRKGVAGGSWMARLRVGGGYLKASFGRADDTLKPDGDRVLDYRQAQAKAIAWAARQQRIAAGEEPEAEIKTRKAYTVADAAADYLADYEARGGKAVKTTATAIAAHIAPTFGTVAVGRLRRIAVRDWHRALAAAPPRRRRSKANPGTTPPSKGLEPPTNPEAIRARQATANRLLTILKALLNHARAEGKATCPADAWSLVKPFKNADSAKVRYLSPEETTRLINAAGSDFWVLVTAALLTGCRYGELAAMKVGAFEVAQDEETGTERGLVFIPESKSGKPRHIALTNEGRDFFVQHTVGRARDQLLFAREAMAKQATRDRPAEMHRVGWKDSDQFRAMAAACTAGRIEPAVSFHILRHTYASRLAKNGVGMQVIAIQLGHASTRMTEKHYAHLAPNYVADEVRSRFGTLGLNPMHTVVTPFRLPQAGERADNRVT